MIKEDIFAKTYKCGNGHTLIPNGHNDLDLMCGETKLWFVPFFNRFGIKGECPVCGKDIKYEDEE